MASLLSWLGDQGKRVVAQVNPFDGGATYKNPTPAPAPQPAAAPARPVPAGAQVLSPYKAPSLFDRGRQFATSVVDQAVTHPSEIIAKGINQKLDSGRQDAAVKNAGADISKAQDTYIKAFRDGKITKQRLDSLMKDLHRQDKAATDEYKTTIANAPSGKQFLGAEGALATTLLTASGAKGLGLLGGSEGAALSTGQKIFRAAGTGAAQNTAAGAFTDMGNGASAQEIFRNAPINAATGAVFGAGAEGVGLAAGRVVREARAGFPAMANERGSVQLPGKGEVPTPPQPFKQPINDPAKILGRQPTEAEQAALNAIKAGGTKQDAADAWKEVYASSGRMYGGDAKVQSQVDKLVAKFDSGAPSVPVTAGEVPVVPAGSKTRGFTESVQNSPETSPELQAKVDSSYDPFSDKTALAESEKLLAGGVNKAHQQVLETLSTNTKDVVGKQAVSDGIAVMKKLDAEGRTAEAEHVHDLLAEQLTRSGQTSQAASLLASRTPEGLLYGARKALKNAGIELTPEIRTSLDDALAGVKATAPGSTERSLAILKLTQAVQQHIPSSATDKMIGAWKAGLLTGVKTQSGNILSNATFEGLHKASNPLASALDYGISLFTGQRTKTATLRGTAGGLAEGASKGKKTLLTGFDERAATGGAPKFDQGELNFKHKAVGTYVNGVFRLMNAADQPFYYSSLRNNLYDMAKADGLSKGFHGAELRAHMDDFVQNAGKDVVQKASDAASKSVLGYDTFLSGLATKIRTAGEGAQSPIGKKAAAVALNVLAPFTRVPSAFLSRTLDFTPIGAVKEAVTQMSKGSFDQRALVTALSEATTGSAVMYLGAQLANHGILSGDYPTDPKEQQRWKAEGIQPNSVLLGDKWYSMNYFGPVGILFSIGKHVTDAQVAGESVTGQATQAIGGLGKSLLGQSFLQGLNNAVSAVNEPGRYLSNVVKSTASSIVPTLSNDAARATDDKQRATNGIPDAIQSRVPGLREGLPVAKDAFGNELDRASGPGVGGAIDQLANPFRPSLDHHTSLLNELDRLNKSGQSIFPTPDKKLTLDGIDTKLSPKQADEYNTQLGQRTQEAWNKVINTPEYKALSDEDKQKTLSGIASDLSAVTKREFSASHLLGQYSDGFSGKPTKLTGKQDAILQGGFDVTNYTSPTVDGTKIHTSLSSGSKDILTKVEAMPADKKTTFLADPKNQYAYDKAKFENDKANGKLSKIATFTKQQALDKQSITSKYSSDVVDLYGMSKANRQAAIDANPELGSLMGDVQKLSSELYGRKFTSSDKIAGSGGRKGRALISQAAAKASTAGLNKLLVSSKVTAVRPRAAKAPKLAKASVKVKKAMVFKTRGLA